MAKVKIRDLRPAVRSSERSGRTYSYSYYDEFLNLCLNSIRILQDGEPLNWATQDFVKRNLIERGAIGFDNITEQFGIVAGQGINKIGRPTTLTFFFLNGQTFIRPASYEPKENGAYILYALPAKNNIASVINYTADFMEMCDNGIWQNTDAIKTPYVVSCRDEDTRLSLLAAIDEKQEGQAAIMVSSDIAEGLKAVNLSVEYVADKILDLRDKERDHLLNKLGIMSANINKKERVQVGEVNATLGQVIDYIYLMIDTFNNQCESYSLPFTMELNNALEEIYEPDAAEDEGAEFDKEGDTE